MKILYAGTLTANDTALYRTWALQRLGHQVIPFDVSGYQLRHPLLHKVAFRLVMGPHIERLNRDLLAMANGDQVDAFIADKLLELQPRTLRRLRQRGIVSASYMIDNAFGPRRDPGWRLYMRDLREFDLHITQRAVSVRDLQARGARDVLRLQTAYEPTLQFPPPPAWTDRDRDRQVSFIGTPYDQRADFLTRLVQEAAVPLSLNGSPVWHEALRAVNGSALTVGPELYLKDYREAIWRSRINLSFLTHSNQDEFAHKSFEIAGCGGFLLAERSPGHTERFVEGEEAVFFSDFDECVAQVQRYLPDEAARTRIATAGQRRAERDGYHNDHQMSLLVAHLERLLHQTRGRLPSAPPDPR